MSFRILAFLIIFAAVSSTAPAQPTTEWSQIDPPSFVVVGDLTAQPGLEALYWNPFGNPNNSQDLEGVSLVDFSLIETFPRPFIPVDTSVYIMDLAGNGTPHVILIQSEQSNGGQEAGAYYHDGTRWVERWYNSRDIEFMPVVTDLQLVALDTRSRPYLMATGNYLYLNDPITGVNLWASDDPAQGPGPNYRLTNWTLADYNGDGQGDELLVEFFDTFLGTQLWMIGKGSAATGVGPLQSTLISLGRSRPNPMFGETTIRFEIPSSAPVHLRIVDARGRHVATVAHRTMAAGSHLLRWDGRDDDGGRVAQGVYFYELSAAGQRQTRKMVVVR